MSVPVRTGRPVETPTRTGGTHGARRARPGRLLLATRAEVAEERLGLVGLSMGRRVRDRRCGRGRHGARSRRGRGDQPARLESAALAAGHTEGLETAPDEWQRQVIGFLHTSLAAGQPKETS